MADKVMTQQPENRLSVPRLLVWILAMSVFNPIVTWGQDGSADRAAARAMVEQALLGEGAVVCEVAVLPKSSTAPETLLASVDYSGRHFCNEVVRIRIGSTPIVLQRIETLSVDRLQDGIRGVDQDGNIEFVIPRSFSLYEGAIA